MAGAFPLIQESSSMEYTTNEGKIFYWPGPPILGEMVADDLKYTTRDVRLLQSRPWEWNPAAAEEELSRRLTECDGWPVMVPEEDERTWIE
ncbi:hypothetical protein E4U13_007797, partial [Claviceps humidiphila]